MTYVFFANAQQGWELGGWLGASHYFGDLNTEFRVDQPGFAAGVIGRYNFNNRICLKFSANYGKVAADDAHSKNTFEQERNLNFQSRIVDGAVQLEFNFLPYIHGSKNDNYTPYLFAGLNVFNFSPKTEYNGEMVELRSLGTEGQFRGEEYYATQGGMVYGIGFKFDLNYEWSINIEFSGRRLFTDYLDDVSGVYPDMGDLESLRGDLAVQLSDRSVPDENDLKIGQEGRQRGNSKANDSYVFFGAGVLYYFGSLRCPTVSAKW
ncbi:MAG TPA: hypothetical protein ENJ53_02395 [Phaeodactylibacter sp.]|nr:hypothetical protein [Phaeodactylibacter sp.]